MAIPFGAFPEPSDKEVYTDVEVAKAAALRAYYRTDGVYKYVLQVSGGYIVRSYSDMWIEFGGPDECVIVAEYSRDHWGDKNG